MNLFYRRKTSDSSFVHNLSGETTVISNIYFIYNNTKILSALTRDRTSPKGYGQIK